LDVLAPFLVFWNRLHVAFPFAVHPEDGKEINQPDPWMTITDGSRTTQNKGKPITERSEKRQPSQQKIGVGDGIDPVISALNKRIALHLLFRNSHCRTCNGSTAHRFTSSALSISLGPKRT